jgi:hypothetical protein
MKNFYALACLLFVCGIYNAHAQVTPPLNQHVADKPALFASLPDKLECNLEEVDRLFTSQPLQKLVLRLSTQLQLDGTVAEKVQKTQEILTINFKSGNYNGALFTISRIIQDGSIRYTGRIVSKDHGDVLILVKENEKYYFTRMAQKYVMTE